MANNRENYTNTTRHEPPAPPTPRANPAPTVTPAQPTGIMPMPPLGVQPAPIATAVEQQETQIQSMTVPADPSLYFRDVRFEPFQPNDGTASLFRMWVGAYHALRSDREEFTVPVRITQSDTPYVIGPTLENALELLMTYRGCMCKPSKKVMCGPHRELANLGGN